jgi:hypothetical protein
MRRVLRVFCAGLVPASCKSSGEVSRPTPPPIDAVLASEFQPVKLPDPKVAGFAFPESAAAIAAWVAGDPKAIAHHAWGLWTALMMDSRQSFEGQALRVFETWFTVADLEMAAMGGGNHARRAPNPLGELARLAKARHLRAVSAAPSRAGVSSPTQKAYVDAAVPEEAGEQLVGDGEDEVLGNIKFDPEAAQHIADNELLSTARLKSLAQLDGQPDVPAFPSRSVVAKAIFQIVPIGPDGLGAAPRYQPLPHWSGPPSPPAAHAPGKWPSCVWIDTLEQRAGTGTGAVDDVCRADGSSRTPASTYGLGSFVYFMMTPGGVVADATLAGAEAQRPKVGDAVVLVGMHVTTRETPGWTWQTFWWSPTPDRPVTPSSPAFAAERPPELVGSPRHYAGCAILSMQLPAEPLTGGAGNGESVYCYNPWLEAAFDQSDLVDSVPGTFEGKAVRNDVGVQSNCMSCHAQAAFALPGASAPGYTGDRYVDIASAAFAGTIRTDFMWSVAGEAR